MCNVCIILQTLFRFDTKEGDGLIERNMAFSDPSEIDKKNLWLCTIKTSSINGAGTDAGVSMMVYGDKVALC
jgi:hypothetical protein